MPSEAITVLIPCQDNWDWIETTLRQLAPHFAQQRRQMHVVVFDNASRRMAPEGWPLSQALEEDTSAIRSVKVVRLEKQVSRARVVGFGLQYARRDPEPRAVLVLEMEGQDRTSDVAGVLAAFEKGNCRVVFPAGKGWLGRIRSRWATRLARMPLRWLNVEVPEVGSFRLRPRLKIGPVVETPGSSVRRLGGGENLPQASPGVMLRCILALARRSPHLSALLLAARPHLSQALRDPQLERYIVAEEIRYERGPATQRTMPQTEDAPKAAEVPAFPSVNPETMESEPTDANQLRNLMLAIGVTDGHGEDLAGLRSRMLQRGSDLPRQETRPVAEEPTPEPMAPVGVGPVPSRREASTSIPQAAPMAKAQPRVTPTAASPTTKIAPAARIAEPQKAPAPTPKLNPTPSVPATHEVSQLHRVSQPSVQTTSRHKIKIPRVHVPKVRIPEAPAPAAAASNPTRVQNSPNRTAIGRIAAEVEPAGKPRSSAPASIGTGSDFPGSSPARSPVPSVTQRMRAAFVHQATTSPAQPAPKQVDSKATAERSAMPMFAAASSKSSSSKHRSETAPIAPSPARMRVSVPRDIAIGGTNGSQPAPPRESHETGTTSPQRQSAPANSSNSARRPVVEGNPAVAIPPGSKTTVPRSSRIRLPGSQPAISGANGSRVAMPGPTTAPPGAPASVPSANGIGSNAPSPTKPNPAVPNSTAMDVVRRLRAMRDQSK